MGRGVEERVSSNGEVEVVRQQSGRELSLSCFDSRREMPPERSNDEISHEDDESSYLPLPTRRPNRKTALIEDEEDRITVPSLTFGKGIEHPTFHPALKAAILAEGQEAMWVEDEISTVAEVVMPAPPAPPQPPVEVQPKPRTRRNFLFGQKRQEKQESVPEPKPKVEEVKLQKIQVKKKKVKKAVVLLPQHGGGGAQALDEANVAQEAAVNMIKARQLLQQALLAEGTPRLQESETMAKVAFAHATAARRLMATGEDGPNLDEILNGLSERGEHAAFQHQKIVFSQSFEDTPKNQESGGAPDYACKAFHYLESIMPKNLDQDIEKVGSDDVWTEEGLSSLGFATDTFEYKLEQTPSRQVSTNLDLVSLSSLNEILDGPVDDENRPPSPRQVLPVIDVPNRRSTKKHSRSNRAVERGFPKTNETQLESENISSAANGINHYKKLRLRRGSLAGFVPKLKGKQENPPSSPKVKKTKWKILGKLGKRQNNDVIKPQDSPLYDQERERVRSEYEITKTSLETEHVDSDGESGSGNKASGESGTEKQVTSSERFCRAVGALPSVPSKSLDSENDSGSNTDRYRSTQFKKSEERNYHVSFDNSVHVDENSAGSRRDQQRSKEGHSVDDKDSSQPIGQESSELPKPSVQQKKPKDYQSLYIHEGRSGEHTIKSLHTNDWDESVHRYPGQSLSIETSNDDGEGAKSQRKQNPDPVVVDQDGFGKKSSAKAETENPTLTSKKIQKGNGSEGAIKHTSSDRDDLSAENKRKKKGKIPEQDPVRSPKHGGDKARTRTDARTEYGNRHPEREKEESAHLRQERPQGLEGGNLPVDARREQARVQSYRMQSGTDESKRREVDPEYGASEGSVTKHRTTRAEDDSLINFVISPGRIELPTDVHGNRPQMADRPAPVKSLKNAAHLTSAGAETTISENSAEMDETSALNEAGHEPSSENDTRPRNTKIISRIAFIFGGKNKKGRNQANEETPRPSHIEKSASSEKDLEQAISDGNMKAFEANENAEVAPPARLGKKKHHKQSKVPNPIKGHPGKEKAEMTAATSNKATTNQPTEDLEAIPESSSSEEDPIIQAIKNGNSKAEETNVDSEDAPILQHLKALQKKQQRARKREKDGRRRHRERSPLPEKRTTKSRSPERPKRSKKRDPSRRRERDSELVNGSPTPRRSKDRRSDTKYDQRAVTARLYGGEVPDSSPLRPERHEHREGSHKHRHLVKSVYIGDLVDSNRATMSTVDSEESHKEVRNRRGADPSVCGERRRVRADPV